MTAATMFRPRLAHDAPPMFWAEAERLIALGRYADAIGTIADALASARAALSPDAWRAYCADPGLEPVRELVHEEPYTRRGFTKPRGYAGDAVLLDYIYGCAPLPDDTTPLGRALYASLHGVSRGFASVAWRRDHFAARIDEAAESRAGARVASIACGHFREGTRARAIVNGRLARIVALDQDADSLSVVRAEQGAFGVEPLAASVRDLVTGRVALREFDLVYAAGLFDYLGGSIAARLAATLFRALRPGGRLVIAQFERMHERGWMEALMDWWLIYRGVDEVIGFTREIPPHEIETLCTYRDPQENVLYLEVRRG